MFKDRLLKVAVIGLVVTALCCFTPILVVVLTAIGLTAAVAWLDMILLPLLGLFAALSIFAYLRGRRAT